MVNPVQQQPGMQAAQMNAANMPNNVAPNAQQGVAGNTNSTMNAPSGQSWSVSINKFFSKIVDQLSNLWKRFVDFVRCQKTTAQAASIPAAPPLPAMAPRAMQAPQQGQPAQGPVGFQAALANRAAEVEARRAQSQPAREQAEQQRFQATQQQGLRERVALLRGQLQHHEGLQAPHRNEQIIAGIRAEIGRLEPRIVVAPPARLNPPPRA